MQNTFKLAIGRLPEIILLVSVLMASSTAGLLGTSVIPSETAQPCQAADPEWKALLAEVDMLVLGELHGSREIPEATQQAVCVALESSVPVVLGLEIFTSEQERIENYLKSSGDADSRIDLLAGLFWQREQQDGRASQAMLQLLEAARLLIQAGNPLTVHCFDAPMTREDADRDHSMARSLLARQARQPEARFIVLMGNIHARKTIGMSWNPDLKPVAWYLAEGIQRLVSLNARYAPGTFWACTPECGTQELGGRGKAGAQGIELLRDPAGEPYDGVFEIGTPTASRPAKELAAQ